MPGTHVYNRHMAENTREKPAPCDHPNWKPRGPKRYHWTLGELAALVDRHPDTIRRHIKAGRFDPLDLGSVVRYVMAAKIGVGVVKALQKSIAEGALGLSIGSVKSHPPSDSSA